MIVPSSGRRDTPTGARHHFAKTAQKQRPILVIYNDHIPRIAARSDYRTEGAIRFSYADWFSSGVNLRIYVQLPQS